MRLNFNRRKKTILISIFIILFFVFIFISGYLLSDTAFGADFSRKSLPPSLKYPFGTDWLGRNMFFRTLKGLSLSILTGTAASAVSAVIAVIVGIVAATGSKALDSLLNLVIDLVMGIPHLVLLILISFACGGGMEGLLIGIAVTHWTNLAKLIRGEVLQIRSQQYIKISRKLGHQWEWILINHILPHMVPQFIIGMVLIFPHAILHESALSFLGYGLPPEQPAIGIILSESMKYLSSGMWWLAVFPGAFLVFVVVLFDKLGDNVKLLLDPVSAQE